MGGLKKSLKKSFNFSKNVFGGGYVRDLVKNPKKGFSKMVGETADVFGGGSPSTGDAGADNINRLAEEATAGQARLQALQTQAGLKGLNAIAPAYAAARKNVTVGRDAALERAAQTGAQNQSAVEQSITARGLRASSVFDNAKLGIAAQNTQRFADIDADYAQMLAQLDIGEGQATTQANQFLSGTYGQQASGLAGLKMQQAGLAASMYEDPDAWLDSIFGIAGTAIGVGIGKNL